MAKMYRQGDILIVEGRLETRSWRAHVGAVDRPIVVENGEATGHHHMISTKGVYADTYFRPLNLQSRTPFVLEHNKHAQITIDAGDWHVVRQREWTGQTARRVYD